MIKFIQMLYQVNSVKKEINKVLALVKSHHHRLAAIEKKIDDLNINSHPPLFTKTQYESLDSRIGYVEAFVDNLVKIADDEKNLAN